jgi:hypothetical protein
MVERRVALLHQKTSQPVLTQHLQTHEQTHALQTLSERQKEPFAMIELVAEAMR